MQSEADIVFEKAAGIATITMNRPRVYNAVHEQTFRELIEAFTDAADDGTIGVIVLTGEGGNFSSGGDISWEKGFSPAAGRRTARLTGQLSYIMRTCSKPIIAKVRGYCIAAGNELNMLCDLTIAAETARFGQAGTKVVSAQIWWGSFPHVRDFLRFRST